MTARKGVKVAMSADFLTSFSRIPRGMQTKVLNFINKFRSDPVAPGGNYERVEGARDPNMRSVRVDQAYRAIVLKPETGNVYMLLWVDRHDEAYRWAKNRVYRIHPETGSIQVIQVEASLDEPEPVVETGPAREGGLFAHLRDRDLLKLGIPEIQIPMVRGIETEAELDEAGMQLPQEAYEALFYLAAGESLEEVLRSSDTTESAGGVDIEDYATALDQPDSKRRFFVVEDELELASILNAPLEKWRVFLHPAQRKMVERDWNGPVRVLGGAGTGKTVVAIHRARWLAQHVFTKETDRVLFTTFTRNLAADIRQNLTTLCTPQIMRRIEVVNLDKWVSDFLRKGGYHFKIDYGPLIEPLWKRALDMAPSDFDLEPSFYREEWERVIQSQAVTSLEAYFKASRVGRGRQLNRKARKAIWPVFEEYRLQLDEHGLRERDDALRDARLLLENRHDTLPYQAIVVDEAQDMGDEAFRLIRQMIPGESRKNDLFVVGDAHQRIYRHRVVLGRCGINIMGRSRKLKINYRTTDENRKWAVGLLTGVEVDDLDGGVDDQKGYKSLLHGVAPRVLRFETFEEEVAYILSYLREIEAGGEPLRGVCLVARTDSLLRQYESDLREQGIAVTFIRRSEAEDQNAPGLRMATMHQVKGLEFDRVIIAGVNEGIVPFEGHGRGSSDPVVRRDSEVQERALLYVAATRARKEVLVTSFGTPSRFLTGMGGDA